MKAQRLQAQFIKKRDLDQQRCLQTNGKQKSNKQFFMGKIQTTFFFYQLFRNIMINGDGLLLVMNIGVRLSITTKLKRN